MCDRQIYLAKLLDQLGFVEREEEEESYDTDPKHITIIVTKESYSADTFAEYFQKRGYVFPMSVGKLLAIEERSASRSWDAILSAVDSDEGMRVSDTLLAIFCNILLPGGILVLNTEVGQAINVARRLKQCGFMEVALCNDAPGYGQMVVGKYMPPVNIGRQITENDDKHHQDECSD